jgi:2-polyprenyl-6-methoxyphenol hydroxylase-like FAD-dependent oxidoreductase
MNAGHALVVGGGIGGLAAAVGLRRAGWAVSVRERREDPWEAGSGLSLWPNALRALDVLGLGDAVRDVGTTQAAGGIRDRQGRWLVRTDAETLARRHGEGVVVLPRRELLGLLRSALPDGAVTTGAPVSAPELRAHRAADLVVGADGIGSMVRTSLFPGSRLRSTGTEAWRLVAPVESAPTEGGESWGDGDYAGVAPWPDGRHAQLWAVTPLGAVDDLAGLRRRFAGWHHPIPELLAATDEAHRTELSWLPPLRSLTAGRTVLTGDAAHAMTPNLGQGGCQALEDAAVLSVCLLGTEVDAALVRYDALRRPRTARLTRMSRLAGLTAGLSFPLSRLRDVAVRATPAAVTVRGLDTALAWGPPPVV